MTTAHLNDLFDKMEPEKGNKLDDKIQVDDSYLQEIMKNYQDLLPILNGGYISREEMLDKKAIKNVDATTITKFSSIIQKSTKEGNNFTMGHYLTKLIQESDDEKHTIFLDKEDQHLNGFCKYIENKSIVINGDVGVKFADHVKSSKIVLNGNCIDCGMGFRGDKLYINGDCETTVGFYMISGKIYVSGKFMRSSREYNQYKKKGKYTLITPK